MSKRTMLIGSNGSGKTQFGVWLLSKMPFGRWPWVIVDYKRETLFRKLHKDGAIRQRLKPNAPAPSRPGLYLVQPMETDEEAMDAFFWRIYDSGRRRKPIGLYLDEGTMVPAGPGSAIRALLTQGRAMGCPIIVCSQRPVAIDHTFFTEANMFGVFRLIDREDRRTVSRYAPIDPDLRIERYHSIWYDSADDQLLRLQPVPAADRILSEISGRAPRVWWR